MTRGTVQKIAVAVAWVLCLVLMSMGRPELAQFIGGTIASTLVTVFWYWSEGERWKLLRRPFFITMFTITATGMLAAFQWGFIERPSSFLAYLLFDCCVASTASVGFSLLFRPRLTSKISSSTQRNASQKTFGINDIIVLTTLFAASFYSYRYASATVPNLSEIQPLFCVLIPTQSILGIVCLRWMLRRSRRTLITTWPIYLTLMTLSSGIVLVLFALLQEETAGEDVVSVFLFAGLRAICCFLVLGILSLQSIRFTGQESRRTHRKKLTKLGTWCWRIVGFAGLLALLVYNSLAANTTVESSAYLAEDLSQRGWPWVHSIESKPRFSQQAISSLVSESNFLVLNLIVAALLAGVVFWLFKRWWANLRNVLMRIFVGRRISAISLRRVFSLMVPTLIAPCLVICGLIYAGKRIRDKHNVLTPFGDYDRWVIANRANLSASAIGGKPAPLAPIPAWLCQASCKVLNLDPPRYHPSITFGNRLPYVGPKRNPPLSDREVDIFNRLSSRASNIGWLRDIEIFDDSLKVERSTLDSWIDMPTLRKFVYPGPIDQTSLNKLLSRPTMETLDIALQEGVTFPVSNSKVSSLTVKGVQSNLDLVSLDRLAILNIESQQSLASIRIENLPKLSRAKVSCECQDLQLHSLPRLESISLGKPEESFLFVEGQLGDMSVKTSTSDAKLGTPVLEWVPAENASSISTASFIGRRINAKDITQLLDLDGLNDLFLGDCEFSPDAMVPVSNHGRDLSFHYLNLRGSPLSNEDLSFWLEICPELVRFGATGEPEVELDLRPCPKLIEVDLFDIESMISYEDSGIIPAAIRIHPNPKDGSLRVAPFHRQDYLFGDQMFDREQVARMLSGPKTMNPITGKSSIGYWGTELDEEVWLGLDMNNLDQLQLFNVFPSRELVQSWKYDISDYGPHCKICIHANDREVPAGLIQDLVSVFGRNVALDLRIKDGAVLTNAMLQLDGRVVTESLIDECALLTERRSLSLAGSELTDALAADVLKYINPSTIIRLHDEGIPRPFKEAAARGTLRIQDEFGSTTMDEVSSSGLSFAMPSGQ
ncbi:MAG: hypothetical protein AAF664_04345 [Planctomycetota bacterium]